MRVELRNRNGGLYSRPTISLELLIKCHTGGVFLVCNTLGTFDSWYFGVSQDGKVGFAPYACQIRTVGRE